MKYLIHVFKLQLINSAIIMLRGDYSYHDGTKRSQLVVERPCLCNVTRLECDLETTAAHPKAHAVHVDVVRFGSSLPLPIVPQGREVVQVRRLGQLVLENWAVKKNKKIYTI